MPSDFGARRVTIMQYVMPKPTLVVQLHPGYDTKDALNYVQDQVISKDRGTLTYDPFMERHVMALEINDIDKTVRRYFAYQAVRRIWLVTKTCSTPTVEGEV